MYYETRWKFFMTVIDFIGNILFFWTKLKKLRSVKKILVIRLDHIGDVVLSTPVFRALKNKYKAEVHVLARNSCKEILEGNKHVDKVIAVDVPWHTYKKEKTVSKIEVLRLIRENLRKNRYDLVVELHADVRNILIAFLTGGFCIGYGIRGFEFLLNKVAKYDKNLHIIDKNLNVLSGLGINLDDKELEISVSDKDMEIANKFCDERTIIISPGAERVNKLWINERWAELADKLIEEKKYKIIFVGSKNEIELINKIINFMEYKEVVINLVGTTNLKQLCGLIKKSCLLISSDAAPVHIAKAVKTRSIALYGPTDPGIWGYNEGDNISIYKKLDCSFCNLGDCCIEEKYRYMKEISVEDVYGVV